MLVVGDNVMRAFSDEARHRFHAEASRHVSNVVGGRKSAAEIAAFVDYGILRADLHGIGEKESILSFLDLMLVHGTGFDTDERSKGFVRALAGAEHGWQKVNRARLVGEGRDPDRELADMENATIPGASHHATW